MDSRIGGYRGMSTWRRRAWMLAGLAAALLLGLGLASWRLGLAARDEHLARRQRAATVSALALADLIERAGEDAERVRSIARRFTEQLPNVRSVRVIRIEGILLEASTAPRDDGQRAAPRRLVREEKELSDQALRLRATVQTRRAEGGSGRGDEIEFAEDPEGGLLVAAPLERDGEVVGMVDVSTAPPADPPPTAPWSGAVLLLGGLCVFAAAAAGIGERRWLLALVAVGVTAGALWLHGRQAKTDLAAARNVTETVVSETVVTTSGFVDEELLSDGIAPGPPPDPPSWDADRTRAPRDRIREDGTVDERALAATVARVHERVDGVILGSGVAALAVLLFIGLGAAERTATIAVRHRHAYSYALPAMLSMLVLVFLPFSYGILLSFTDSNIYNTDKTVLDTWIGLDNFKDILFDFDLVDSWSPFKFRYGNFYFTAGFTVLWTVSNVSVGVLVGLALALILNTHGLVLRPIYRVIFILPWAMPNYITSLIWKGMFHPQFGVVNQAIQMLGGEPVPWFSSWLGSFTTVLATNGWLSVPFMMVISLGALQSIPGDLYEAARVDGASRRQQFRFITLPSLKPALIPAIILSVIWTFNQFNVIYLVSGGEPGGGTEILITDSYKIAFEQYRYGYAAAYSTLIFLILVAYGIWQNRVTRATEGI